MSAFTRGPSNLNPGERVKAYTGDMASRPPPPPPRNSATVCYVMDGGGVPLSGDVNTNAGKRREKERNIINESNMRTHDRLSRVKSTIPKASKRLKKGQKKSAVISNGERKKRTENAAVVAGNRKIEAALNSIYKGPARLESHGVTKKDCRGIWKGRTSIYDSTSSNVVNKSTVKADTGVPSSAAVVLCSGCGNKSYAGADGNKVFESSGRKNMDAGTCVFFCNDVCEAVDWEINHENQNVQNKGFRPLRKANYWVQSQAAGVARRMLKEAVDAGRKPDYDVIMVAIKIERDHGRAQSKAIAKTLPTDKSDKDATLTGAQAAKKHIFKGADYWNEWVGEYKESDIWHGEGERAPKGTYKEQLEREKHERFRADTREIARVRVYGNVISKGGIDKNAPSKPPPEKAPNPAKWKNASKIVLTADPAKGGAGEKGWDKKEMYTTSADAQRRADAEAKKAFDVGQRMANKGKKKLVGRSTQTKQEYENYNAAEGNREGTAQNRFNIKRVSHNAKPVKKVAFVEKPRSFNGLKYDATNNKSTGEQGRAEPKTSTVLGEDDPALFRQSMDNIKLSR